MNGRELVDHLRESILDDVAEPYRWQDTELLRFLNYAEVQACRRAFLITDSETANDSGTAGTYGTAGQKPLCQLSVTPNQAVYRLSPLILQVKRCQLKSMTYPLTGPVTYPEADEQMSGWFGTAGTVGTAGSGGNPIMFLNEPGSVITFILAPSISDTAYLVVNRLPLLPFTLETSPEIEERHHIGLTSWAAHLAFLKPDSETVNLELAKYYEGVFIADFGPLPDANTEKKRKKMMMRDRMRAREFGS